MKFQKGEIAIILNVLLLGIIIIKACNKPEPTIITTTKTVTIPGDKVPYEVPVKVPYPVYHDSITHDTIPAKVDTVEILERFFARTLYRDTVKVDSSFLAIIQEIISQNRIVSRQVWAQNLRPKQVIYQTIIQQPYTTLYIGPQLSFGDKFRLGVSAIYVNGKNSFGGNIDLFNRSVGVSYMRALTH